MSGNREKGVDRNPYPWERLGDIPLFFVIGDGGWGGYGMEDFEERNTLEKFRVHRFGEWTSLLDEQKWYSGYGAPECPSIYVWGMNYVYYIVQYDGATSWSWIPRNPVDCEPDMPGG